MYYSMNGRTNDYREKLLSHFEIMNINRLLKLPLCCKQRDIRAVRSLKYGYTVGADNQYGDEEEMFRNKT